MSTWLQQAALWTWQNSLAAAVLAVAILGLRRIFRARISPFWLCLAGWLVLVRLWLPAPLPYEWGWDRTWVSSSPRTMQEKAVGRETPASASAGPSAPELLSGIAEAKRELEQMRAAGLGSIHPKALAVRESIAAREQALTALPTNAEEVRSASVDWLSAAGWAWMSGAAVFMLGTLVRHRCFLRRLARTARPVQLPWPGVLPQCAATAGLRRVPPLFTVPGGGTPFLCGLFHPRIVIPSATLEMLTVTEARHVLLHEMLHIRRHDLAANWLLAAARSLHWFNPFVHLACRRLLADRELLRDHQAIALLRDPAERAAYGHTLLKLAIPISAPAPSPGLAPFFRSEKELKRRLIMIQSPLHHHRLAAAFATVTLTVLSSVLFTTARGQEKAPPAAPDSGQITAEPSAPALTADGTPPSKQPSPPSSASPARSETVDPSTPSSVPASGDGTVPAKPLKVADANRFPDKVDPALKRMPAPEAKPAREAQNQLRAVADKLRAVGRLAEADAIEEALKTFPMAQNGDNTSSFSEMQQLRKEMAEVKAAIAGMKRQTVPFDPENELARLKVEQAVAASSGFGKGHPKLLALRQNIEALEKTVEAAKKAKEDQATRFLELKKAELTGDPNSPAGVENLLRLRAAAKELDATSSDARMKLEMDRIKLDAESKALQLMNQSKDAAMAYEKAMKQLAEAKKTAANDAPKARRAEAVKPTDQAGDDLPWGVAVPGEKGLVYSPCTPETSVVDVSGFEKRSKVKCPYTGNFFRVP